MGFFRFILATCIACILLAAVTLGGAILYSHNTDDPIIYRTYEDPDKIVIDVFDTQVIICLLYTSPSPRDLSTSRMPSSA